MIGAARYYPGRMFAPRYWPKVGLTVAVPDAPFVVEATAAALYLVEATGRPSYRAQATAAGGDIDP